MAAVVLLLIQAPPLVASVNETVVPVQTVDDDIEIAAGPAITVTVLVA